MTYSEAKEFLKNAAQKGSVLGLGNITRLIHELGDVQEELKVVHIAGTNGKGSTLAYLMEILKNAGYRVGRYTSPAVFDYLEIFSINGENISRENYAKNMSDILEACDRIEKAGFDMPTAFEIETALAFLYFYREKCDIVLIETGMGGDDDATNVGRNTLLSLITPISLDHTRFLGETISEIATHKAGIIKEHSAVITALQEPEVYEVIQRMAELKKSEFIRMGEPENVVYDRGKTRFDFVRKEETIADIETSMCGAFQPYNACLAISAALYLKSAGFSVSDDDIAMGIRNTVWHGRFEKINEKPLVYFDGGHNPHAAIFIRKSIEIYFTNKRIVYIIGVLADKDYDKVLEETATLADAVITVTPDNVRALAAESLMEAVLKYNRNVQAADNVRQAVHIAEGLAGEDGVIMIFGSLSYLGEVRKIYRHSKTKNPK